MGIQEEIGIKRSEQELIGRKSEILRFVDSLDDMVLTHSVIIGVDEDLSCALTRSDAVAVDDAEDIASFIYDAGGFICTRQRFFKSGGSALRINDLPFADRTVRRFLSDSDHHRIAGFVACPVQSPHRMGAEFHASYQIFVIGCHFPTFIIPVFIEIPSFLIEIRPYWCILL